MLIFYKEMPASQASAARQGSRAGRVPFWEERLGMRELTFQAEINCSLVGIMRRQDVRVLVDVSDSTRFRSAFGDTLNQRNLLRNLPPCW